MIREDFITARKLLGKTQKEMAAILGVSLRAVHSYEQGNRAIVGHIERQILFLLSRKFQIKSKLKNCWIVNECPPARKKQCPAWEFKAGRFCWFINGTICQGEPLKTWKEKMRCCHDCAFFTTTYRQLLQKPQSVTP